MSTKAVFDTATASLSRVQQVNVDDLGRESDLGKQLNFVEVKPYATALIDIYKRIPLSVLEDFTDSQLNAITAQANSDYNIFSQILAFNANEGNASANRKNIIDQIKARRDPLFNELWQYISYSVARATDSSLLEAQARATIQSIKDEAAKLTGLLNDSKKDADAALAQIRAVALEQGVGQQASYFKSEAETQETLAKQWLKYTFWFAITVGIFAVGSMFLHKWSWIKPEGVAEAVQLVSSKVLIFTVLGYLLLLASKNYSTHKHNAVVNRHRQNALLTYKAIVDASESKGTEDIILAHAASCIFAPQETGFAPSKGDTAGSKSVLELMTKGASKSGE